MNTERAIVQGIESARHFRKDGESPYNMRHPLFPYWWEAVVLKSDWRDWPDHRIKREVMKRVKR